MLAESAEDLQPVSHECGARSTGPLPHVWNASRLSVNTRGNQAYNGVFHADLHPGNIFFLGEGTVALLDFGIYGELSREHCDHFILYWLAGLQHQTRRAFYHLVRQTSRLKDAHEEAYYQKFKELADSFYSSTITERSLTQTYLDIIVSGARYGFVFPSHLLLQAKALTTAEALAFTLTPDLKFETEMPPIIAYEFARRATDFGRLKLLAERVLPELLLFGGSWC